MGKQTRCYDELLNLAGGDFPCPERKMAAHFSSPFWHRPGTKLGRRAVILAAVFVLAIAISSSIGEFMQDDDTWRLIFLPIFSIIAMLCGLIGGFSGLIAVIRYQERSWMVWLTILPGVFLVMFLLGEILIPH